MVETYHIPSEHGPPVLEDYLYCSTDQWSKSFPRPPPRHRTLPSIGAIEPQTPLFNITIMKIQLNFFSSYLQPCHVFSFYIHLHSNMASNVLLLSPSLGVPNEPLFLVPRSLDGECLFCRSHRVPFSPYSSFAW